MQKYYVWYVGKIYNYNLFLIIGTVDASCKSRSFGEYNFVCVCNETWCDDLELLNNASKNIAALYTTNKIGARFQPTTVQFSSSVDPGCVHVDIFSSSSFN